MNITSRRKFIKQASIGASSFFIFNQLSNDSPNSKHLHLHIKETNFTLSAIAPSVIGFIYTDNPEKIEKYINKLRLKNSYKKTLSFRSTDKYKFQFAIDVIDYFFSEPSIHFYARIVDHMDNIKRTDINLIQDIEYRINYRKAVADLKDITQIESFYLDFITYIPRRGRLLNKTVINEPVPYINFKTSKQQLIKYLNAKIDQIDLKIEKHTKSNLSQMVDFFTGNIYGDIIGIENKTKRELLNYLKKKLNVGKISDLYNSSGNQKFIVSSIHK